MNVTISSLERRVLGGIDSQQARVVELLGRFLAFKTVTPQDGQLADGEDYRGFQETVARLLEEMGVPEIDLWEQSAADLKGFPGSGVNPQRDLSGMPVLAAKLPGEGGGRSLILNGHYDVVPVGNLSDWTVDPFGGEIRDGKMYGRGSCDMKGGIAAMLIALQCLREQRIELKGDVIVQTVPDEEMSCMGTFACCQRGYTADAALIPEPTDMKVLIAMRGSFYGWIKIKGRAGHTEEVQPHWSQGGAVNAISKAQIVLAALDELNAEWRIRPDKQHPLLHPDMVVPTSIHGGGDWAVTIPDEVTIQFATMTLPASRDTRQELEAHVLRAVSSDSWLREHPPEFVYEPVWHYGAEIGAEEPIAQLGLEILNQLSYSPEVAGFGSLTDAIHLINHAKIPTISIGPNGQPAHMADEFVEIQKLTDLTRAIALMLMRWCGVKDG